MLKILIVDDETNIRKTLSYCLGSEGHDVSSVGNGADAVEECKRNSFDMVFLDLRLGSENGMQLIPLLISDSPWLKIVIITAHATISSAVEAIQSGAIDYLPKPFSPEQIRLVVARTEKVREIESELRLLKGCLLEAGPENFLESKNPGMLRILETARKAAVSEAIILLLGESGTGKSVFAKAIHKWSNRGSKPMVTVACPAVPSELLESELFGHAKGAFTGAIKDNPGRIAACEGGTLFLDEIGDLALPLQAKLLRFIQEKEYQPLGDNKTRTANVRILAATNADLAKRVSEGRFREDLYFRLNVIPLTIPPLRQRPEDIITLARRFVSFFCQINNRQAFSFSTDAEEMLLKHPWPGNIRELRNAIERAVILGNGQMIHPADLPAQADQRDNEPAIGSLVSLDRLEELHIRRIIARTQSLQEAADILGIDQATLWRKRKNLGI